MQDSGFESWHDTLSLWHHIQLEKSTNAKSHLSTWVNPLCPAVWLWFMSKPISCSFPLVWGFVSAFLHMMHNTIMYILFLFVFFSVVVLRWVLIAPASTHLSPSCAGVWGLWRRCRCGRLMSPGFHYLLRSGTRQFEPRHILETRTFHFPHKGPFFNLIWVLVNKSLPWIVRPFSSAA